MNEKLRHKIADQKMDLKMQEMALKKRELDLKERELLLKKRKLDLLERESVSQDVIFRDPRLKLYNEQVNIQKNLLIQKIDTEAFGQMIETSKQASALMINIFNKFQPK